MSAEEMFAALEMTVNLGNVSHKIFSQDGFCKRDEICDVIHRHKYTEVHLVGEGEIIFSVGKHQLTASAGTMLVIPSGVYHSGRAAGEPMLRTAFQIDASVTEAAVFNISTGLLSELFSEMDLAAECGDYSGIAAFLPILCRRFIRSERLAAERITDYAFLINEFFSHRYAEDIALGDLAEVLHLSERQTERLVYKHTGGSFRDELVKSRMKVAARLISEGEMSLGEISAYVGYRSYAGFWKAMKKHGLI